MPKINVYPKIRRHKDPWITKGLLKSVQVLNNLYKAQLNTSRDSEQRNRYKIYRNKLNSIKRAAKNLFYLNELDKYRQNIKKTWDTLNDILGKQRKPRLADHIKHRGVMVDQDYDIAEIFNSYFASVGSNKCSQIGHTNHDPLKYMKNPNINSIYLSPTDPGEIAEILKKLKNKLSEGEDQISMSLIKQLTPSICIPLTIIINIAIKEGKFPDKLKYAKVIPIFKANENTEVSNYRPIALLPVISKVFEKVIYKRLFHFMDSNDLFHPNQFGFKPKQSTIDAVLQFAQNIQNNKMNKKTSVGVFADLSKAFDTINHNVLLQKLSHYGIRGVAFNLIKSYLSNRKQFVRWKTSCSSIADINCGVPQGSILGPLLFIIYINDLPNVVANCHSVLYADDTSLLFNGQNQTEAIEEANLGLSKLKPWLDANSLILNIEKSHFIIFAKNPSNASIMIDKANLTNTNSIKFLGIYIDQNLSWQAHMSHIKSKISKSLYIMNRVKHQLNKRHLKTIYYSMIDPYLRYGLILWGNTSMTSIKSLGILQKKAIRIVHKQSYNAHTAPLFKEANILDIHKMYELTLLKYTHRCLHDTLPFGLSTAIILPTPIHQYETRLGFKVSFRPGFVRSGLDFWDNIPHQIKEKDTFEIFCKQLKRFLVNRNDG